jgi:hypothetical protein
MQGDDRVEILESGGRSAELPTGSTTSRPGTGGGKFRPDPGEVGIRAVGSGRRDRDLSPALFCPKHDR